MHGRRCAVATGHSLGGILATLLSARHGPALPAIAFGAPGARKALRIAGEVNSVTMAVAAQFDERDVGVNRHFFPKQFSAFLINK